jgi:hypothetical protein
MSKIDFPFYFLDQNYQLFEKGRSLSCFNIYYFLLFFCSKSQKGKSILDIYKCPFSEKGNTFGKNIFFTFFQKIVTIKIFNVWVQKK